MSYFNTTQLQDPVLADLKKLAKSQENDVMVAMQIMKKASASQLWNKYFSDKCPITSIRRSLTSLKKEGQITKTPERRMGLWGRLEFIYKLIE